MRAERRSLIKKRTNKKADKNILNSDYLEADYSSWTSPMSKALERFEIGEARPDFNINESPLFSHNYFRRGKRNNDEAECLICELSQRKTVLRKTDGNTKGN